MAKDDLYNKLFGITPEPPTTLSKLFETYPPARPNKLTTLSQLLENYPPPAPRAMTLSELMGLPAAPPAPVPAPKGIWFQDRYFSEPSVLASTWLPSLPGIYAILVIDGTYSPRPYRVLYFGKAVDLGERVVRSHEKYEEWNRAASGHGLLNVAYHLMSGSNDWERAAVEEDLIKHYSPVCNKTFNPLAGLFGF